MKVEKRIQMGARLICVSVEDSSVSAGDGRANELLDVLQGALDMVSGSDVDALYTGEVLCPACHEPMVNSDAETCYCDTRGCQSQGALYYRPRLPLEPVTCEKFTSNN